ncbi:MAG TPA: hypothetical protein VFT04_01615 [Gemmatimonadales bacterium]|nr:hypothetical protein [Gemmatimonadales bacterium]
MTGATRRSLADLTRPIQRGSRAGWGALAIGAALLLLGLAAWAVRIGLFAAPWWVFVAWGAAIVAAGVTLYQARRSDGKYSIRGIARWLEERNAWRQGALTALLDPPALGTSDSLLTAADASRAGEIDRRGREAVEPIGRPVRRRALAGFAVLLLGLATLGTAGPRSGTASALWHPGRAWEMTTAPVRIRASAEQVDRGGTVRLDLEAIGRQHATLWTRAPGESWRPQGVRLDSLGRATRTIGPLRSDLHARLTSGSRSSDTVLVQVRLPVFLGSLTVTARYPGYLGLEDEPVPTNGDTIIVPAGTRLSTRGAATAPLASAAWQSGARVHALEVDGADFSGDFVPPASAAFVLQLTTREGSPLGGDTVRLPLRVVPDSAPIVDLPVPGTDTIAPLSMRLGLVVDVRDDHGLAAVTLETRRSGRGARDSARTTALTLPSGRPDRAILSHELDLATLELRPGDTLFYRATAVDDAPGRHRGRSREYSVRIPTASELRAAQREVTEGIGSRLDSLADRSRQLERETEDASREQARGENQSRTGEQPLSYEQAQKAEAIAEAQEALLQEAEALQEALEQLKESVEQAGLDDPAFREQLEQLQAQLDRALTPEMREKLAELQRALQELNAEQTQEALQDLARAQEQLREALERSRELFERAALEGDLANLAEEAKDLAAEQREWTEEAQRADSTSAAAEEQALADRADSLAAAMKETAQQLESEARQEQMEESAEQAAQAAAEMREAQQAMEQGNRQGARQRGKQAAEMLAPLAGEMNQQRSSMQQEWRDEVAAALDRALAETSRLTERELAVQEALRSGAPSAQTRAEQGAIEEGVERLLDQVRAAGGKNALVSQQIGASLALAKDQMGQAREAISSAAPNPRAAAERAGGAVDALNSAAYQLLRSREDVAGAASGSGMAEAMERMAQMAGQQGAMGQQGASLLPMAGRGDVRTQIQQLGAQQRAMAEQLERLRAQGGPAGTGEFAEEARDLARRLEAGRIDRQTVERQERLFRRMLDAGRTLQGEEQDERKERQSKTGDDSNVALPPALRAQLEANGRPRFPSWDELQRLSPEERRLVVDYFRQLSEPTR